MREDVHLGHDTTDEADHFRDEVDKDEGDHEDEVLVCLGLEADHVVDDDGEYDCNHCLEGHADQCLGQKEGGQAILPRLHLLCDLHATDEALRKGRDSATMHRRSVHAGTPSLSVFLICNTSDEASRAWSQQSCIRDEDMQRTRLVQYLSSASRSK